jgi:hypothetical protein
MEKIVASQGYRIDIPKQIWLQTFWLCGQGWQNNHALKSKNGDIIQHYDIESPKPHMFWLQH